MDFAYTYGREDRIYLNVTNRCTNRCSFCIARRTGGLGASVLRGGEEPDREALLAAWRRLARGRPAREAIWCGFGEPTFRLDLILQVSPILRAEGAAVRLNTNGHGCLIQGRDILPELGRTVDRVNVSLNAPDEKTYLDLCRPRAEAPAADSGPIAPAEFWRATVDFLARAPHHFARVQASVVAGVLSREQIEACRRLAADLGAHTFRAR